MYQIDFEQKWSQDHKWFKIFSFCLFLFSLFWHHDSVSITSKKRNTAQQLKKISQIVTRVNICTIKSFNFKGVKGVISYPQYSTRFFLLFAAIVL